MKFPRIEKQEKTPQEVRLFFHVTADIQWFNGHFPGQPILPGVVQIDWAIYFSRMLFDLPDGFAGMKKIKFQQLITPEQPLTLVLKKATGSTQLTFSYEHGETIFSSGLLDLGAA